MARIFKNKTGSEARITCGSQTAVVPAGQQYDLSLYFSVWQLGSSESLINYIGQGVDKYQLNDGVQDLSVVDALDLLRGYLQKMPVTGPGALTQWPLEWAAAACQISGVVVSRATGYVSTSAAAGVAVRATVYAPQGTNAQRSVKSSSNNDTALGTGAQQLKMTYLTSSFMPKSEDITLSGTTAVNTTANDIAYVENMEVIAVGTQGGGNIGTISLYTQTGGGGSVWGSIAIGDNMTYWAHHYIPDGKICYITNICGGATTVAGGITFNCSAGLGVTSPQKGIGGTYVHPAGGSVEHSFRVPLAVTGPDLIWLVERPTAGTASTSYGTFEYVEF